MIKLLEGLGQYLKPKEFVTNSWVFRFHTHLTTAFLFMCSMIVTASQYVGSPIGCVQSGKESAVPKKVMETFCWVSSTFNIPGYNEEGVMQGIGSPYDKEVKYYPYYQWVCFVLFFQGCFFYVPQLIWKRCESNLISTLAAGLNRRLDSKENIEKKKDVLMDYLTTHIRRHNLYVFRYFACEFLCLVNVIVQMYLLNKFLDGEFYTYGFNIMSLMNSSTPDKEDVSSIAYIFPKLTKCTFHKFGPSGTVERLDALCVLPLNIVNEKIYMVMWFWFILLGGLLVVLLIYRMAIVFVPMVRPKVLHVCTRKIPMETCQHINKLNLGDWWILYVLSTNMDPMIYKDLLLELSKKLTTLVSDHQAFS